MSGGRWPPCVPSHRECNSGTASRKEAAQQAEALTCSVTDTPDMTKCFDQVAGTTCVSSRLGKQFIFARLCILISFPIITAVLVHLDECEESGHRCVVETKGKAMREPTCVSGGQWGTCLL